MSRVHELVAGWRSRYGLWGVLALAFSSAALAFIPVPGLAFLPVLIAELATRERGEQAPYVQQPQFLADRLPFPGGG